MTAVLQEYKLSRLLGDSRRMLVIYDVVNGKLTPVKRLPISSLKVASPPSSNALSSTVDLKENNGSATQFSTNPVNNKIDQQPPETSSRGLSLIEESHGRASSHSIRDGKWWIDDVSSPTSPDDDDEEPEDERDNPLTAFGRQGSVTSSKLMQKMTYTKSIKLFDYYNKRQQQQQQLGHFNKTASSKELANQTKIASSSKAPKPISSKGHISTERLMRPYQRSSSPSTGFYNQITDDNNSWDASDDDVDLILPRADQKRLA